MPPGLSRWCHSPWQVLLHEVVFYMAAVADVLYCSSNNYQKKGKTLEREEDKRNCARCCCAAWWEMDAELFQILYIDPWWHKPREGRKDVPDSSCEVR